MSQAISIKTRITYPLKKTYYLGKDRKSVEFLYKPLINIYIGNPLNNRKHIKTIECLVDSGADFNLFPSNIASLVGIDKVENDSVVSFGGIGNSVLIGYKHKLSLFLPQKLNIEVYFSELQHVPVLGRIGFFDQFRRVVFDESRKKLVLQPVL
jgi:hypothetical protein